MNGYGLKAIEAPWECRLPEYFPRKTFLSNYCFPFSQLLGEVLITISSPFSLFSAGSRSVYRAKPPRSRWRRKLCGPNKKGRRWKRENENKLKEWSEREERNCWLQTEWRKSFFFGLRWNNERNRRRIDEWQEWVMSDDLCVRCLHVVSLTLLSGRGSSNEPRRKVLVGLRAD